MAPTRGPSSGEGRPKPKTPAERADEFAAIQRQLKNEAAERRRRAVPTVPKPPAAHGRTRPMAPRRTP
jgi:hypothetical protein